MLRAASGASLSVSVNGQQFSPDALAITLYEVSVVSFQPSHSIYHGGQPVVVAVGGLIPFSHTACKFQAAGTLASDFNATVGVDRWFGTSLVRASRTVDGRLACIAPSAVDVGVSRRLSLTFDSTDLPECATVFGDAHIADGILQLTRLRQHDHGTLLIAGGDDSLTRVGWTGPASPWPWPRFDLRFYVHVGGGCDFCMPASGGGEICGGEGFSVLYGTPPSLGLGQLGGGAGLRLLFFFGHDVLRTPTVQVVYDHHLLRTIPLLSTWPKEVREERRIPALLSLPLLSQPAAHVAGASPLRSTHIGCPFFSSTLPWSLPRCRVLRSAPHWGVGMSAAHAAQPKRMRPCAAGLGGGAHRLCH